MEQKVPKIYPLTSSPLYRLRNKRKLAALLDTSVNDLLRLSRDEYYKVFSIEKEGGKPRPIQAPSRDLKLIHRKLKKVLSRIETPEWLISGKRKKSYVDNAKEHVNGDHMINIDIKQFYPNCKREFVIDTFKRTFLMADDIALLLSDFVTYSGFIPTGSPVSQLMAYWAYAPTFHRIQKLAERFGVKMTVYVDDLTFSSSKPISGSLIYLVGLELKVVGHSLKRNKTAISGSSDFKIVTGCAISTNGVLQVPNKQRFKIWRILKKQKDPTALSEKEQKSLLGRIESARQIEPKFFDSVYQKLRLAGH